jgi:hypothetical protein
MKDVVFVMPQDSTFETVVAIVFASVDETVIGGRKDFFVSLRRAITRWGKETITGAAAIAKAGIFTIANLANLTNKQMDCMGLYSRLQSVGIHGLEVKCYKDESPSYWDFDACLVLAARG